MSASHDQAREAAAGRSIAERAETLFRAHQRQIYTRTDRTFVALMLVQWVAAIGIALTVSPRAWAGAQSYTHPHVWAALLLGGAITLVPVGFGLLRSGETSTRHAIAIGQVLMSSLLIHLTGGRIETHFHIFGSLAFLAFYRDSWLFVPATIVVAADHFLRGVYWPESVFGVTAGSWRWLEHTGWVLFEDAFLVYACLQSVREMRDIAQQRARLEFGKEETEAVVKARTADLEASENLFRSLSAASPIGIVLTDAQGNATYSNERWSEITGIPSADARGDGWMAGVHSDDLEDLVRVRAAAIREERELEIEFRYVTPWGVRWVHARVRPLRSPDGVMIGRVGTVEDVTQRRQADAAHEEDARTSRALVHVGRELISSLETPVLLERLCTLTANVLGADYSTTWLRQKDEDVYTALSNYGFSEATWEKLRAVRFPLHALGAADRKRLLAGEVVVLRNDPEASVSLLEMFSRHGAAFALCIPLLKGDVLVGAQVAGYRDRATLFTPGRERIGRGIGQLASMALTNALLYEEVADASRLKSEFVSTMSHELRTPLNVIIGYTDMLADEPPPGERAELLAKVRRTSLELLEMISATLDLNRIAAGKDVPHVESLRIGDLWATLRTEFDAIPRKPGVVLRWEDPDGVAFLTDRRKLTTIVKNLVGNALKFTAAGEITVTCCRGPRAGTIIVRDTGIGIAKDDLASIFEMFRQVDSSDSRSYAGAGLGLYLVQRLVTQLGGTIEVASDVGRGSEFRVTLAVAPKAESVVPPQTAAAS